MTIRKAKVSLKKATKMVLGAVVATMMLTTIFAPEMVKTKTSDVLAALNANDQSNDSEQFPEMAERAPRRTMWVVSTSYSSDPRQTDSTPCLPAMNYDLCEAAKEGVVDTIAANFLKLGTKVRFPELYGDKIFTVRDRMNARYNGTNRIDMYSAVLDDDGEIDIKASTLAARQFGVKKLKMEIL